MKEKNENPYKALHNSDPKYGTSGVNYIEEIRLIIDYLHPRTVLDYGCGKGALLKALSLVYPEIRFYGYDPNVEDFAKLPETSIDLVLCTDVLEHIPEDKVEGVLSEIALISPNVFFALDHAAAYATLPDGSNAHCLIKPSSWYVDRCSKYWKKLTLLGAIELHKSTLLTFAIPAHLFRNFKSILDAESRKKSTFKYLWHSFRALTTRGMKRTKHERFARIARR